MSAPHPGSSRRRGSPTLKGRQVDLRAIAEVAALLGEESRAKDVLIEHLHKIQDHYGAISERHLAALAAEMRLSMAEVYECATFYARFDVIPDGEPMPPPVTVRVCESLSCMLAGADALAASLASGPRARVLRGPCIGRCAAAPSVEVGEHRVDRATKASVESAITSGTTHAEVPKYTGYDDYVQDGGWALYRECLAGTRDPVKLLETIEAAGLRGMGGAGFPAGKKWRFVRAEKGPRLMALNADEGEPGTFKDRFFLETNPHRVLEGMLIAAWVIEAKDVYVYLRDEYPAAREILTAEIHQLRAHGLDRATKIHLRRGAGAYICGEESAMLESIEGKRGWPRLKPPFPAQVGLFGRPTLIQNVETMYWVPEILAKGPDWWASQGRNGRKGLRSYSLSGRVKKPGVYVTAAGITVRQLIDEFGGGMLDGHVFKAYLPGGASGGILPASLGDLPLDFDVLQAHGCFIGSAAIIVLSNEDSMREVVGNLMRFFEDESCGQCTPCRNGTEKTVALLKPKSWDRPLLAELGACMKDASICGLGQAAPNPLETALKHFSGELG
jgi:NADH:ubiquinone oxidoreductase subunit F (NADH-binding)/NADH:ubiquinone oxidoreductase subunit E